MHRTQTQQVIRFFVSIVTIITMMFSPAVRMPSVQAEGSSPHLHAILAKNQVELFEFIPNSAVQLTVTDGDNPNPFDQQVNVDDNGYLKQVFDGFQLANGMTILAQEGEGEDAVSKELALTPVAFTGVNYQADTLSGVGPANQELTVRLSTPVSDPVEFTVQSDASGDWTLSDLDGYNFIPGGEDISAEYIDGDGDSIYAEPALPFFILNVADDTIELVNFPAGEGETATVSISDADDVERKTMEVSINSPDSIKIGRDQHEQDLQPGWTVTVEDDSIDRSHTLTIPALAVGETDIENGVVHGTANSGLGLIVYAFPGDLRYYLPVTSADGAWSADFHPYVADFASFENVYVMVAYYNDDSDCVYAAQLPVPIFQASLVHNWIQGWNFTPNAAISATISGQTGEPLTAIADENGFFMIEGNQSGIDLVPEMTITISDGINTRELTLAAVTLDSVDLETNIITGTAPLGADVIVNVDSDEGHHWIPVQADETGGQWSADFSTQGFQLKPGMGFYATLADTDGDLTFSELTPAHIDVWLDSNNISGYEWPYGVDLAVAVTDDQGETVFSDHKTTTEQDGNPNIGLADFTVPQDTPLQPGMKITMTAGRMVRSTTIQDLAAPTINVGDDTLSGTAIQGAHIWSCVDTQNGCIYRDTTAAADGSYVLDYSQPVEDAYDLVPGDRGGINWDDGMNNQTSRSWKILKSQHSRQPQWPLD